MILVRHHNEGNLKPYFYFALEEYILTEVLKDDETYFFTWEIHGVVIGKNQVIENEVNLAYLKSNQIDVYRRPTGGGCVYADHRNTMFSIITKRQSNNFSFKKYLSKIIDSMKLLNVDIEFSGRNDLLYQGKKISGNAFLQNKYGMLMHGTFLYDCDLETMVRAITPSDEKLVSKGVDSVRSRVCNLKPYLHGMTQEQLIKHFENTLTYQTYELSDEEVNKINTMAKKYESKSWIYKKQPPHTKMLKRRISGGLVEVMINLQDGLIKDFKILGDFFDTKPLDSFEKLFIGKEYTLKTIHEIFEQDEIDAYILDVKKEEFKALLTDGVIIDE
ncbi:MAG: lipoate--protein ligase [Acholeplasmataceae bacterium]|nr:lipoate--protein ligase [Acholeplasmataceae bacterium]